MLGGIWYVEFPLSKYNEDVNALASERGLTVISTQYQGQNLQMSNPPILTLKEKSHKK